MMKWCESSSEWDSYVLAQGGHPLQLWGWGEVKSRHGWRAKRLFVEDKTGRIGAAQLLIKSLPKPFRALVYCPRGPVTVPGREAAVLEAVRREAASLGAVALTIEPDAVVYPMPRGFRPSPNTILLPRTIWLELEQTDDELLARMTKKTRQYIRKSERDGVEVRPVTTAGELQKCLAIYRETAVRAGFALHDDAYYHDIQSLLGEHSPVFAAWKDGEIVAFLWLAASAQCAFELYGGVNDAGQQARANYILKWRAIQAMKARGVKIYDLNGLLNDGILAFKQGFSDHETQLVGTYDYPLSPLYTAWTKGLPAAKKLLRMIKSLR